MTTLESATNAMAIESFLFMPPVYDIVTLISDMSVSHVSYEREMCHKSI